MLKRLTMRALIPASLILVALVGYFRLGSMDSRKREDRKMPEMNPHSNRLAGEKSPYLLQHADNPVDWYPWGEEAFALARRLDKPIFLSIGYSTCHWCHVMEHESFEDPETARLLNETFVCIKVDREERPDIDNVYMTVCQMLTGSGGWPLTVIMTPHKKPFFAATYIPREDRYGRAGLKNIISQVRRIWSEKRSEVERSAEKILAALVQATSPEPGGAPRRELSQKAFEELRSRYDAINGGFGGAPKFPAAHNLLFLLRYWKANDSSEALQMVAHTLEMMRLGGIYDHVGFGFHRYSTDATWHLPHFEKMLYDQAMLGLAYTEAFLATRRESFKKTALEVFSYVLRDMTDPGGGFYSAEDADSEGEEGKFYLWTLGELESVLNEEEKALVEKLFRFSADGNFSDQATGSKTGANVLHRMPDGGPGEGALPIEAGEMEKKWEEIRRKLYLARQKRIRPGRDDKILADWNGLMIASMAKAGRAFDDQRLVDAAVRAAGFIGTHMVGPDGMLLHRYRGGDAAVSGHLDDYAYLVWGLIELYEATFDVRFLEQAVRFNRRMIEHFEDEEHGGFFFTKNSSDDLPVRTRDVYDGAIPSGNSVAAMNLVKLARLTGDADLEERAWRLFGAFSKQVERAPAAHTFLLSAFDYLNTDSREVVIAGSKDDSGTRAMLAIVNGSFFPDLVVLLKDETSAPLLAELAPYTRALDRPESGATAYVCRNFACDLPVVSPEDLAKKIE